MEINAISIGMEIGVLMRQIDDCLICIEVDFARKW